MRAGSGPIGSLARPGVEDSTEDSGPNGGDGNGDGTPVDGRIVDQGCPPVPDIAPAPTLSSRMIGFGALTLFLIGGIGILHRRWWSANPI